MKEKIIEVEIDDSSEIGGELGSNLFSLTKNLRRVSSIEKDEDKDEEIKLATSTELEVLVTSLGEVINPITPNAPDWISKASPEVQESYALAKEYKFTVAGEPEKVLGKVFKKLVDEADIEGIQEVYTAVKPIEKYAPVHDGNIAMSHLMETVAYEAGTILEDRDAVKAARDLIRYSYSEEIELTDTTIEDHENILEEYSTVDSNIEVLEDCDEDINEYFM